MSESKLDFVKARKWWFLGGAALILVLLIAFCGEARAGVQDGPDGFGVIGDAPDPMLKTRTITDDVTPFGTYRVGRVAGRYVLISFDAVRPHGDGITGKCTPHEDRMCEYMCQREEDANPDFVLTAHKCEWVVYKIDCWCKLDPICRDPRCHV